MRHRHGGLLPGEKLDFDLANSSGTSHSASSEGTLVTCRPKAPAPQQIRKWTSLRILPASHGCTSVFFSYALCISYRLGEWWWWSYPARWQNFSKHRLSSFLYNLKNLFLVTTQELGIELATRISDTQWKNCFSSKSNDSRVKITLFSVIRWYLWFVCSAFVYFACIFRSI